MYPELAMVRMGQWQDLLSDTTTVNPEWTFAALLHHFALGMAQAKTGNLPAAEKHLATLREKQTDKTLRNKFAPHTSSPYQVSEVAEHILQATIHYSKNEMAETMTAIRKAIRAEDSLIYAEPKIWLLPARQYLGAFLMQQKKPAEAENVFREDLVWNPGNGWSLLGLYQALKAQGKTKDLAKIKKRYLYSFSQAEAVPQTSAY
jgi:tetratricopeptide (TPR) repeat protein